MNSPFAIFRKHAQVLTVALLGLAMFAFVVMDNLQAQQVPYVIATLLGGSLFFWASKGKEYNLRILYSVVGCAAGILVCYFSGVGDLTASSKKNGPIKTNLGEISVEKQKELLRNYQAANQFLYTVQVESLTEQQLNSQRFVQFNYDPTNPNRNPILGYILADYADSLNIVVTDQTITDYLNSLTKNELSKEVFKEACKQVGMTGSRVYQALRPQLKAMMVTEFLYPQVNETPEALWETYLKTAITQELQVVPVVAEDFLPEVGEVTEAKAREIFEQFKMNSPGQIQPGSPGFLAPRKFELEYIKADYLAAETEVAEVTDAEIEKFYEENKENYRNFNPLPETTEEQPETNESTEPVEEEKVEEKKEEASSEQEPAKAETPEEKPEAEPQPEEKAEEQSSLQQGSNLAFASVQDEVEEASEEKPTEEPEQKPTEETPEEKAPTEEKKVEEKKVEEKKSEEPSSEETPQKEPAANETPAVPTEEEEKTEEEAPKPEFRPLDDDLKEEIRATILRERTTTLLNERMETVLKEMRNLSSEYQVLASSLEEKINEQADLTDEQREAELKKQLKSKRNELTQKLKEIAEKQKLTYGTTNGPQSQEDLRDPDSEIKLGLASPVNAFQNNAYPVWHSISLRQNGSYIPAHVQESGDQYVYWKTDDLPQRIPNFEDEGVYEQVVEAGKLIAAKERARARAEELLEMINKNENKIADTIAEQTMTGEKEAEKLSFIDISPFSWLTESSAANQNFGGPSTLQITSVPELDYVGEEFMKTIFDEMEVDQISVVPNADKSIFYITKVLNREPNTDEGMAQVHQNFVEQQRMHQMMSQIFRRPSPYLESLQTEQFEATREYIKSIENSYGVEWNN